MNKSLTTILLILYKIRYKWSTLQANGNGKAGP